MARQLNIRSDEAHRLASSLARRLNMPASKVVEKALRELEKKTPADPLQLTPEQEADHQAFRALIREAAKHKKPGATSDHTEMYDEFGLPI